jgi:16S rRNA (guanine966-N2)-methyltransferase
MRIIGGAQRGRKLLPPTDRSIRPALDRIREAIFSVVGDRIERASVLDLFAGVGAFGLESLSRGARRVHFVDASRGSISILRKNVSQLGYDAFSTIDCADAFTMPDVATGFGIDPKTSYDLIFLDPPFPLFKEPEGAARVFGRVSDLRAAFTEACIVLRQPKWYRQEPPFESFDKRTYGESTVLFLSSDMGTARRLGDD